MLFVCNEITESKPVVYTGHIFSGANSSDVILSWYKHNKLPFTVPDLTKWQNKMKIPIFNVEQNILFSVITL